MVDMVVVCIIRTWRAKDTDAEVGIPGSSAAKRCMIARSCAEYVCSVAAHEAWDEPQAEGRKLLASR
jgi:hypothetical protein